jgi:small subunit ribosomal protein S16
MKRMGRKNRPYYRIVAIDARQPRDGRVLEELGTYDPSIRETDNRVTLKPARVKHWISVGAKPSDQVQVLLTKYMKKAEEAQAAQPPAEPAPAT